MLIHWTVHYVTTLISFYFVFFDFPTFFHLDHLWHFHAEVLPTSLSVFFSSQHRSKVHQWNKVLFSPVDVVIPPTLENWQKQQWEQYTLRCQAWSLKEKKAFSQSKLYMSLGRSGHLQVIFIFLITFPLFSIFPVSFLVVPIQKVIVKYQNSENVQSTRRPSKLYIFFPCALPARGSGEHSSIRLNVMFIEELLDDSQPSDLFLRIL